MPPISSPTPIVGLFRLPRTSASLPTQSAACSRSHVLSVRPWEPEVRLTIGAIYLFLPGSAASVKSLSVLLGRRVKDVLVVNTGSGTKEAPETSIISPVSQSQRFADVRRTGGASMAGGSAARQSRWK